MALLRNGLHGPIGSVIAVEARPLVYSTDVASNISMRFSPLGVALGDAGSEDAPPRPPLHSTAMMPNWCCRPHP